jgi:hypothetical protein
MGKNLPKQGFLGLFSLTCLTICNAQLPFGNISASKNESVITVNFGYAPFETETELWVYRSTTPNLRNAIFHAKISNATLVDEENLMVNHRYYYWFKSVDRHGERGFLEEMIMVQLWLKLQLYPIVPRLLLEAARPYRLVKQLQLDWH